MTGRIVSPGWSVGGALNPATMTFGKGGASVSGTGGLALLIVGSSTVFEALTTKTRSIGPVAGNPAGRDGSRSVCVNCVMLFWVTTGTLIPPSSTAPRKLFGPCTAQTATTSGLASAELVEPAWSDSG